MALAAKGKKGHRTFPIDCGRRKSKWPLTSFFSCVLSGPGLSPSSFLLPLLVAVGRDTTTARCTLGLETTSLVTGPIVFRRCVCGGGDIPHIPWPLLCKRSIKIDVVHKLPILGLGRLAQELIAKPTHACTWLFNQIAEFKPLPFLPRSFGFISYSGELTFPI